MQQVVGTVGTGGEVILGVLPVCLVCGLCCMHIGREHRHLSHMEAGCILPMCHVTSFSLLATKSLAGPGNEATTRLLLCKQFTTST